MSLRGQKDIDNITPWLGMFQPLRAEKIFEDADLILHSCSGLPGWEAPPPLASIAHLVFCGYCTEHRVYGQLPVGYGPGRAHFTRVLWGTTPLHALTEVWGALHMTVICIGGQQPARCPFGLGVRA